MKTVFHGFFAEDDNFILMQGQGNGYGDNNVYIAFTKEIGGRRFARFAKKEITNAAKEAFNYGFRTSYPNLSDAVNDKLRGRNVYYSELLLRTIGQNTLNMIVG